MEEKPQSGAMARKRWTKRAAAFGFSGLVHVGLIFAFITSPGRDVSKTYDLSPIKVEMVKGGGSPPAGAEKAITPPAKAPKVKKVPVKPKVVAKPLPVKPRPAPPSRTVPPLPAAEEEAKQEVKWAELSASEVASATKAGSGSGTSAGTGTGTGIGAGSGRTCDMLSYLEAKLADDARVRAAMRRADNNGAAGKTVLLWNGDWTPTPGEDGRGMSGLREAIMVEVGFAPAACRNQAMRGHVVLHVADARVALGGGSWRWSDLLGRR